ncbi:hypothetical protein AURDEDRAFT_130831 [Auricularia subglabra TFB-10046 SS5]|uniref:Uncharacterized protein n=1 Tax=Auricularia subglabra (strain TFB-10046 / SS5) TaxID=717982 RepID=J0WSC8_AURST|nr:hypothetical protein AURDEDRAFT_130831 [Auricularia subglabra TFB-10046 SS5]
MESDFRSRQDLEFLEKLDSCLVNETCTTKIRFTTAIGDPKERYLVFDYEGGRNKKIPSMRWDFLADGRITAAMKPKVSGVTDLAVPAVLLENMIRAGLTMPLLHRLELQYYTMVYDGCAFSTTSFRPSDPYQRGLVTAQPTTPREKAFSPELRNLTVVAGARDGGSSVGPEVLTLYAIFADELRAAILSMVPGNHSLETIEIDGVCLRRTVSRDGPGAAPANSVASRLEAAKSMWVYESDATDEQRRATAQLAAACHLGDLAKNVLLKYVDGATVDVPTTWENTEMRDQRLSWISSPL